jgi:hypothetical protein
MIPTGRRHLVTGAIALLALLATACAGGQGKTPQVDAQDPGIGHVHGLGVDPADDTVYIAGHFGLFQVRSADSAVRVADRIQDHMGFTVVGPKTFLASGHPSADDMPAGVPPHLGLIRTTDAGVTWTPVSEAGVADFHALQLAGTSLYAYDSQTGRVRRSLDNGRTWREGAQAEVADLAGNAARPNRVYATTSDGPKLSNDGGKTFTALADAPLLTFLDEPRKDLLVGIAIDGTVRISDDGAKWKTLGEVPGQVTAFTVVDEERLLAATEEGTVYESKDGGQTFSVIYEPASG